MEFAHKESKITEIDGFGIAPFYWASSTQMEFDLSNMAFRIWIGANQPIFCTLEIWRLEMVLKDTGSSNEDKSRAVMPTEPLWTVVEVANYLRLKRETVRLMARANKIPAIKVGKVWRFRASEIKDFMKSKIA